MDLMEKLQDKLAEKSFSDPKFQQSWEVHMKAFGPILEPAFKDNTVAKIHLTAALNQIGRGECNSGANTLKKVQPLCQSDADRAAFLFCMGLAMDQAGDDGRMLKLYQLSNEYNHRFYLPYMKVAKNAHSDAVFEIAETNYRKAIECLTDDLINSDEQLKKVAIAARSNLGSCLTMMHCYDEAEALFDQAERLQPGNPDLAAPRAILYAAIGNQEKRDEQRIILETNASPHLAQTRIITDDILAGRDAHFSAWPPERGLIKPFWIWFEQTETDLISYLRNEETGKFLSLLAEKLQPIFPFMKRELEFGVMYDKEFSHFNVDMADFFSVSMNEGYNELLAACPDALKARWSFNIVR